MTCRQCLGNLAAVLDATDAAFEATSCNNGTSHDSHNWAGVDSIADL